jgi:hypothetical protein
MWHEHRESTMFWIGFAVACVIVALIVGYGIFTAIAGRAEKRKPEREEHEDGLLP